MRQDGEFWSYTKLVYGKDDVRERLLALQDTVGADVNLLLYCGWLAESGRGRVDQVQLRRSIATIENWHDSITRALRSIRTDIRNDDSLRQFDDADAVRARILEAEVQSERVAQNRLETTAPLPANSGRKGDIESASRDVTASLSSYLTLTQYLFEHVTGLSADIDGEIDFRCNLQGAHHDAERFHPEVGM